MDILLRKFLLRTSCPKCMYSRVSQGNVGQYLGQYQKRQSHKEELCFAICKRLDKLHKEISDDNFNFNYICMKHLEVHLKMPCCSPQGLQTMRGKWGRDINLPQLCYIEIFSFLHMEKFQLGINIPTKERCSPAEWIKYSTTLGLKSWKNSKNHTLFQVWESWANIFFSIVFHFLLQAKNIKPLLYSFKCTS